MCFVGRYVGVGLAQRGYRICAEQVQDAIWEHLKDRRTGAAENTGHLDELDGLLCGIHFGGDVVSSNEVGEFSGWTEVEG